MIPLKSSMIIEEASSSMVSEEIYNSKADILTLEVSGSSGGCSIVVEGKVNTKATVWNLISGINLSDYTILSEDGMTNNGIYQFGIDGIQLIRVNVITSDGAISVYGRATSEV